MAANTITTTSQIMKLKPQQLYLYAFNTCKKGLLSSGKNHVFFRLNDRKDAIEMSYANPEKRSEVITLIRNGIQFSVHPEKGFIFSYKDASGKECSVLLRPCTDVRKYPLCLREGVDYYDNEDWINKIKTWFMEAKTIINATKAKIVKKALQSVPTYDPNLTTRLEALRRGGGGGCRKKHKMTRKTNKTNKNNKYIKRNTRNKCRITRKRG